MDTDKLIIAGLVILTVVFVVFLVIAQRQDEVSWKQYAADHHCQSKGVKRGQIGTGSGPVIGANGKVGFGFTTIVTPDQTIYVCDGGEMVIR